MSTLTRLAATTAAVTAALSTGLPATTTSGLAGTASFDAGGAASDFRAAANTVRLVSATANGTRSATVKLSYTCTEAGGKGEQAEIHVGARFSWGSVYGVSAHYVPKAPAYPCDGASRTVDFTITSKGNAIKKGEKATVSASIGDRHGASAHKDQKKMTFQ
ncbi:MULTISPECIES: hypothetical protein [Actinomadura]|uniref:Uncharacterized protein n=1 Tax=Actinomadura yumaensis TaxID=111807 RepID=A0ABW2CX87_9ACTN|nr:hypothetical protein [Actinomadura sp. J1-007]MWK39490.1 hypothetical protein [Actinomadura sp. J1-007]